MLPFFLSVSYGSSMKKEHGLFSVHTLMPIMFSYCIVPICLFQSPSVPEVLCSLEPEFSIYPKPGT